MYEAMRAHGLQLIVYRCTHLACSWLRHAAERQHIARCVRQEDCRHHGMVTGGHAYESFVYHAKRFIYCFNTLRCSRNGLNTLHRCTTACGMNPVFSQDGGAILGCKPPPRSRENRYTAQNFRIMYNMGLVMRISQYLPQGVSLGNGNIPSETA